MTIAWAIIIVAVLFLLEKHRLLKKAVLVAAITACVFGIGFAGILGYQWIRGRWENHQFAKLHDCYNPSNGNVEPVNESGECAADEQIHQRGTPLPPSPYNYNTPIPAGATVGLPPPLLPGWVPYTPSKIPKISEAVYLRSVFNDYLAAPDTLPANFFSQQMGNEFALLDKWDRSYYKSKFVVLSVDKATMGGNLLKILFLDKPDTAFTAWVYTSSDGEPELRGFDSAGLTEEEMVKVRDTAANLTPVEEKKYVF